MAERIKMGLVGCGGMSGAHMGGYRQLWSEGLRDYEIVAACDIAEERAEERRKSGARVFKVARSQPSIQNSTRCWRNTPIWSVLTSVHFTVPTTRSPYLRWRRGSTLSSKSRSVSQCGHAN